MAEIKLYAADGSGSIITVNSGSEARSFLDSNAWLDNPPPKKVVEEIKKEEAKIIAETPKEIAPIIESKPIVEHKHLSSKEKSKFIKKGSKK